MAFVALIPVTLNITVYKGLDQQWQAPLVQTLALANVDLSAWTSLTAKAVAPAAGPNTADVTFGTVTGATGGVLNLKTGPTDFASSETGTARLVISGKPTSTDDAQVLCTGTITLAAA